LWPNNGLYIRGREDSFSCVPRFCFFAGVPRKVIFKDKIKNNIIFHVKIQCFLFFSLIDCDGAIRNYLLTTQINNQEKEDLKKILRMYRVYLRKKKGDMDPEDETDFIEEYGKRGNSNKNYGFGFRF